MRLTQRLLAASFALLVASGSVDVAAQTVAPQPQTASSPSVAPAAPAAPSPSLRDVVADSIQDFRNLPTWQNLFVLSLGGIGARTAHVADPDVTVAMSGSTAAGTALQAGETLGGARTQLAAALATYTLGRVTGQSRVATIGADLISAQILTQSMTAAIKLSVGRTRPDGTQYSFPSGHASVTFATATVLQRHLGWKVGVPAYGLATYVAASRVHDQRHFLSDVAFGAALGIIGGRSVTLGSGNTRFAMSPAPAPGGAAVAFTWTPE
jgi:membrane-associated phospholipid phosphatase